MKRLVIVAGVILAVGLVTVLLARRDSAAAHPPSVPDASLLFLSTTNLPGGSFVSLCLSDSTSQQIALVPEAFELRIADAWTRAPLTPGGRTAASNWSGLKNELKPGESCTFLVPPPTNAGAWRLVFMCQERSAMVDPVTDTVRHLADTNAAKTGLRQYSGRRYHVASPEVRL
jgi:hypothetical protein